MTDNFDFTDIAPFDDRQFKSKMERLVHEPGFEHAVKYVMPDVDFPQFVNQLLMIPDKETFQLQVMHPVLEMLAAKTTKGLSCSGIENIRDGQSYTFITNHRDIVLDASFLNLCLIRAGIRTSEVAIGNNLLIYEWITDLVKLNKSFIVKRNLRAMQALDAARQLSAYIHHTIREKNESVWIAQREGRAKDSNDMTQESLVKMLALGGEGSAAQRLMEINLMPVAISYEYDPNDYLKAREFLLKRENPQFKKSPADDLKSMETGIVSNKGRVHFRLSPCLNPQLEPMAAAPASEKLKVIKAAVAMIDKAIHSSYEVFPVNYIAYDMLEVTDMHRDRYTDAQLLEFRQYIESQLDKTDIPGLTVEQRGYMYRMMLTMYANPLRNMLKAVNNTPHNPI